MTLHPHLRSLLAVEPSLPIKGSITDLLAVALSENQLNAPKPHLEEALRVLFAPKLHEGTTEGFVVQQGDAAISERTLITGGLATCTAIVITSQTHNFVCHIDSRSNPDWIANHIDYFCRKYGPPVEIARYNCHGEGLNTFAEERSRSALKQCGLFDRCIKTPLVTALHTVGARGAEYEGSRLICDLV